MKAGPVLDSPTQPRFSDFQANSISKSQQPFQLHMQEGPLSQTFWP